MIHLTAPGRGLTLIQIKYALQFAQFVDLRRSADYDRLASSLAEAGFETWDPAEALFAGDNWALRIGQALQDRTRPAMAAGNRQGIKAVRLVSRAPLAQCRQVDVGKAVCVNIAKFSACLSSASSSHRMPTHDRRFHL